jgi:Domain of unknown function (DUF4397)
MKRLRTVLFLLALTLVVSTPPASGQSAGWIRLAHLSPDAFDVDVYVAPFRGGNQVVLRKVGYGDVSGHQRLAPGRYTVSMRPAGASPSTPAILSKELEVAEGQAYTVAGMGMAKALRLDVLRDDLTIPPSGKSRVRVIQASARAASATVTLGDVTAGPVQFASASKYVQVPAGRLSVGVKPESGSAGTQALDLRPGAVYSLALLDAPKSGIRVVRLLDAAGSGRMPASVNAGYGGAASGSEPPGRGAALAAAGLLLGAGVVLTGYARRNGRTPRRRT